MGIYFNHEPHEPKKDKSKLPIYRLVTK